MQPQKVSMDRRRFRIGDLAEELNVKKFVIRFWEKEFAIQSDRSEGGQRFYTTEDLRRFMRIKDLLYNKGFTIAGAKKQLYVDEPEMSEIAPVMSAASVPVTDLTPPGASAEPSVTPEIAPQPSPTSVTPALYQEYNASDLTRQLIDLKEQLLHLKDKLKTS
jgi:DNA-binding transcriptional MerR regulator